MLFRMNCPAVVNALSELASKGPINYYNQGVYST